MLFVWMNLVSVTNLSLTLKYQANFFTPGSTRLLRLS